MNPEKGSPLSSTLRDNAHMTEDGIEFWFARDLQRILGYAQWRNFTAVVNKAKTACESAGFTVSDHFVFITKLVKLGADVQREIEDIKLTRFACYMIALNGDPGKQEVALAQTYFAIQTKNAINDEQFKNIPDNKSSGKYEAESHMEPTQKTMLKVFLCHASEDKNLVRIMYKQLKQGGFSPWLDEIDILPGQDWQLEISQAVKHTNVVLVCLSIKSVTKAGFIQKEIKYALDKADEQPEGAIFVIPVKFEECNVPQRLSKWQWVNYFENGGHEKLINALNRRCTELDIGIPMGAGLTY